MSTAETPGGPESRGGRAATYRTRAKRPRSAALAYFAAACALPGAAFAVAWFADVVVKRDVDPFRTAEASPAAPQKPDFNDVALDPSTGRFIVVGDDGVILTSERDGRAWRAVDAGTEDDLHSIAVADDGQVAVAVGDAGAILTSRGCCESWAARESNTRRDFNEVALSADGETAVAVGEDGLIRVSDDRGETWRPPKPTNVTAKDVNGVAVSPSAEGVVSIVAAGDDGTLLRSSSDAVETWREARAPPSGKAGKKSDFEAVAFGGARVVAVGDDGAIVVSSDAGENWEDGSGDAKDDFEAVAFSGDGETGVAVGRGRDGFVRLSADGGETWSPSETRAGRLDAAALSADGRIAVAAGRDGALLIFTRDDGAWTGLDSETSNRFNAIAFGNGDEAAIAVGDGGTIARLAFAQEGVSLEVETIAVSDVENDRRE